MRERGTTRRIDLPDSLGEIGENSAQSGPPFLEKRLITLRKVDLRLWREIGDNEAQSVLPFLSRFTVRHAFLLPLPSGLFRV